MGKFTYYDYNGAVKESHTVIDSEVILRALSALQSNSTSSPTEVAELTVTLAPGTYQFQYFIIYQAAATTTGVRFSVNFSGTASRFVANWHVVDNGAAASTAAADQDAVAAGGQVYSVFSARAKSTAGWGTTISVDSADADMFAKVEGIMVVTTAGTLQLWHGSEVNAASSVRAGTSLVCLKTS